MAKIESQPVDVICQHSKDGTIIPIRVRIIDEDGIYQTIRLYYNIRESVWKMVA